MDGATAMDGNGRHNRVMAMAAMEDGRRRGDGDENNNNHLATGVMDGATATQTLTAMDGTTGDDDGVLRR